MSVLYKQIERSLIGVRVKAFVYRYAGVWKSAKPRLQEPMWRYSFDVYSDNKYLPMGYSYNPSNEDTGYAFVGCQEEVECTITEAKITPQEWGETSIEIEVEFIYRKRKYKKWINGDINSLLNLKTV